MVTIPAGEFQMGSNDGGDFEQPVHTVWLDEFKIDTHPVTNRQFAEFIAETGYVTTAEQKGSAWGYQDGAFDDIKNLSWKAYATETRQDHPVVLVSWHDANAFAEWAAKRLPTEAEWEKAARGSLRGQAYPWGDDEAMESLAGYNRASEEIPPTSEVGQFPANGYGIHDMVGNVWQWCSDLYDAGYYQRSPGRNPRGADIGEFRCRRGASWNVIQTFRLRCANRGAVLPETTVPNMGFRCAK
jgi:sulfatase modifying factor 1